MKQTAMNIYAWQYLLGVGFAITGMMGASLWMLGRLQRQNAYLRHNRSDIDEEQLVADPTGARLYGETPAT